MKIDLYTKLILTGILACLLWLCVALTPVGAPAHAQLGPTSVIIAGFGSPSGVQGIERGLPVAMVQGSSALGPTTAPSAVPTPAVPSSLAAAPAPSRPPRTAAPTQQVSVRCQATTQKGAQCKRTAKAGSSYCWQHGG